MQDEATRVRAPEAYRVYVEDARTHGQRSKAQKAPGLFLDVKKASR